MPGITPLADVKILDPGSIWGVQITPPHSLRDPVVRMQEWYGYTLTDVARDEVSNVLTLKPLFIPVDTEKADWTLDTAGNYIEILSVHTNKTRIKHKRSAAGGLTFSATKTVDLPADPCFFLDFYTAKVPRAETRNASTIYRRIEWPFGETNYFKLEFVWDGAPRLYYVQSGVEALVDRGRAGVWDGLWSGKDYLLSVFTLDDWCVVYFGDLEGGKQVYPPLRYHDPDHNSLNVVSGALKVSGKSGVVEWGYHPVRYPLTGQQISAQQDAGFSLATEPTFRYSRLVGRLEDGNGTYVAGDSDSTDIIAASIPSPTDGDGAGYLEGNLSYRYRLDFEAGDAGDGYADTTPILQELSCYHPGQSTKLSFPILRDLTPHVTRIREKLVFDLNSLTVIPRYAITCNNRHGEFTGYHQEGACEISLGWDISTAPLQRRFLGRTGRLHRFSRQDPVSTYSFNAVGREVQLQAKKWKASAYFDGQYHAWVVGFLAQYGGITAEWLGDDLLASPDQAPAGEIMGIGLAGQPSVRFAPNVPVWSCMHEIRHKYGHMMYFDKDGRLRYYPFVPSSVGPSKKSFDVDEALNGLGEPYLNQIFRVGDYTTDLTQIRNDLTVVAYNPGGHEGGYLYGHERDEGSWLNASAPNYIGYLDDWVDASPLYSNATQIATMLEQMQAVYGMPIEIVRFECWGQPDLYPMDIISVSDGNKAIPGGGQYFILEMDSTYSRRPQDYKTTITARNLTPRF